METFNSVTMSLEEYDGMKEELFTLREEKASLTDAIEALKENAEQKVIIKEVCTCEDEDGEECECTTYAVKGFDDVKKEIEDFYKGKFEEMENTIKEKTEKVEKIYEKSKELHEKTMEWKLEKDMEISRLKHRNLWQRILNK